MDLMDLKIVIDFALVVLIWTVQLIIYPSFLHYEKRALVKWHTTYTLRISFLVAPLMLAQLGLASAAAFYNSTWHTLGSLCGVLVLFGITFLIFVPMHKTISDGLADMRLLQRLVRLNWWRTFLWTLVFGWTLCSA